MSGDLMEADLYGLQTRSYADIAPECVKWLWPGRIPLGKLTLIAGDPGLGKSMLATTIAARVSRGGAWPDDAHAPTGDVLLLSAEDGAGDTIRRRLDAAGADVSRIHNGELVRDNKGEHGYTLHDVDALAAALARLRDPRLVVIDPVTAYLDGTDSHVASDVRGLLAPLAGLADRTGVAVVLIAHLNKTAGMSAMYRVGGSGAFVAAVRAAWLVTRDKDDQQRRLILPLKVNLSAEPSGLAYTIETDTDGRPVVAFARGAVTTTADDALAQTPGPEPVERREAEDWLRGALADGPLPSNELRRMARDDGHAWATVRRARTAIGVQAQREGGIGKDGRWVWTLNLRCSPPIHQKPEHLSILAETQAQQGFQGSEKGEKNKDAQDAQVTGRVSTLADSAEASTSQKWPILHRRPPAEWGANV